MKATDLSAEDVRYAYRLILDREPESQQVVDDHSRLSSRKALLRHLIRTKEALAQDGSVIPVGLHMEAATNDVAVDATAAQRRAMLGRIASAWRLLGENEPHWSVLTDSRFLTDTLDDNIEEFYRSGAYRIKLLLASLSRNDIDQAQIGNVLDFGCGVGRLSLALAEHFPTVTGVDISLSHLRHAVRRAARIGRDNVHFQPIGAIEDLDQLGAFDLVFTEIVLQHNPPPVIAALIERLFAMVAANGVIHLQVPTFIDGFSFDPDTYLSGEQPQMEMNAIPQHKVFAIAARHGCVPCEVREDDLTGNASMVSQTFLFRKG